MENQSIRDQMEHKYRSQAKYRFKIIIKIVLDLIQELENNNTTSAYSVVRNREYIISKKELMRRLNASMA
jgi:hypothetical protein